MWSPTAERAARGPCVCEILDPAQQGHVHKPCVGTRKLANIEYLTRTVSPRSQHIMYMTRDNTRSGTHTGHRAMFINHAWVRVK